MFIDISFIILGTIFSLFYGVFCKQIWFPDIKITKSKYAHEIWFNFISSLVGWVSFYILYKSLFASFVFTTDIISWQSIILFLIGMLGITGLLPYTIWSISRMPNETVKLIEKTVK